ncbi:MAG: hypothetical protein OEM89_02460 [Nitrosopumilus sp.]|nr:hypothetical protein [Nitrosopumilus sp.]
MTGRTAKSGLLTNMEKEYLIGNMEYSQKQKATLLKSLVPRINAISEDIQLIYGSENPSMKKWLADNWNELYTFGERIKLRHYSKLQNYRPGHIKITKKTNEKNTTPLYWLDLSDRKHMSYNDLPWPDHWTRKIRNKEVKQILHRAFVLEEEFWFRKSPPSKSDLEKSIIPIYRNNAISIKEIQKRVRSFENKLK